MPDNWAHRSENMLCSTCMFFVPKKVKKGRGVIDSELGRCRERSPTLRGFTPVFDNDWCGQHKLDETKI